MAGAVNWIFFVLFGWLRVVQEDETFFSCDFIYLDPKIGGFIRQLDSSMVGHGGAVHAQLS